MEAIFQIIANGDDVTKVIQDRVMEIRTVDKPGLDADECTITLDDRDGRIRFPPKGATVKVSLGWEGQGLSMLGEYAVDEVGLRGPPASVVFLGKPANMRATSKTQRYGSWSNVRLADIVGDVARRNKWAAACDVDVVVPRVDQFGESDLHFVTRLARQYGATATVKAGKLIVLPRGGGKSASGKPLPVVTLTPELLLDYDINFPDRASFAAVRTKVHDRKTGKKIDLTIPNPDAPQGRAWRTSSARCSRSRISIAGSPGCACARSRCARTSGCCGRGRRPRSGHASTKPAISPRWTERSMR